MLAAIEEFLHVACAVLDAHALDAARVVEQCQGERPQRGQAHAAAHHQHVLAVELLDGIALAEGPTHAEGIALAALVEFLGECPGLQDGDVDALGTQRGTRRRKRRLPHPGDAQLHELSRTELDGLLGRDDQRLDRRGLFDDVNQFRHHGHVDVRRGHFPSSSTTSRMSMAPRQASMQRPQPTHPIILYC